MGCTLKDGLLNRLVRRIEGSSIPKQTPDPSSHPDTAAHGLDEEIRVT